MIVTWNSAATIGDALAGLTGCDVTVVDNASTDSTREIVATFPKVRLICSGRNLGFGAACNLGAAQARGKILLFLNPDTLPQIDALVALADLLRDPHVGIAMPALSSSLCEVADTIGAFPSLTFDVRQAFGLWKLQKFVQLRRRSRLSVDWGHGACLAIRASTFRKIGGFASRIFLYGEDMDICYRVRQLGLDVVLDREIVVAHARNVSGRQAFSAEERARIVLRADYEFRCTTGPRWRADLAFELRRLLSWINIGVSPGRRVFQRQLRARGWR